MLGLTMALAAQLTFDKRIVRAAPAGGDAAAFVAIADAGEAERLVGGFARAGALTAALSARENTAAAWQGAAAPAAPAAPALAAELQPLAFLVGSCWRATFPNSTNTDTHCYTAMLGGRYIRDVHVVAGAPTPYSGESIYRWDPQARRIRYDYYASDGGYSGGFADATPTGMTFPDDTYVGPDGQTMALRTVQTRDGEGHARTSFARQPDGSWREMWTMRFTRVGPATAPR